MHDCPICGESCDCDGEDVSVLDLHDCEHQCFIDADDYHSDYEAWNATSDGRDED